MAIAERLVAIDVAIQSPSVLVTISDGNERPPPYVVENSSPLPVLLHQKGSNLLLRRTLEPASRVPYVWDVPTGRRTLEVTVAHPPMFADVPLDEVGDAVAMRAAPPAAGAGADDPLASGLPRCLWLQVSLHDKTRTLTISAVEPQAEVTDVSHLTLTARLKGIDAPGVREIAYACLSDILLETTVGPAAPPSDRTRVQAATHSPRPAPTAASAQP